MCIYLWYRRDRTMRISINETLLPHFVANRAMQASGVKSLSTAVVYTLSYDCIDVRIYPAKVNNSSYVYRTDNDSFRLI